MALPVLRGSAGLVFLTLNSQGEKGGELELNGFPRHPELDWPITARNFPLSLKNASTGK